MESKDEKNEMINLDNLLNETFNNLTLNNDTVKSETSKKGRSLLELIVFLPYFGMIITSDDTLEIIDKIIKEKKIINFVDILIYFNLYDYLY